MKGENARKNAIPNELVADCRQLATSSFPDGVFVDVVLALVLGATGTALACPVCFRVEENATTDGVQVAVLVLVGVTTVVLGAFARFVVLFARREGELNGDERPSEEVVRD